ncbi:ankyrin repeat domain-containing protein [Cardinium endosymbiont of Nabis limbatus]|uniref:ankyrin repeat domain-containing protein n=1 Tax=Cardinium endosymbiont of Nabis limbatus TaxID=3066217 RepID=UPI003AF360FC
MKQFKLNLKLPIFRSIALLFLLLVLQAFYFPFQKCGRKVKDNGNNEKDMPDKEGKGVKGIKLAHLHKAAGEGDVEEVRRILEKINTSTEEDKENFLNSVLVDTTALGKAIKNGFEPIVRLLIQQPQVDINETGKELPSLLLALKCNQPEIAKVLLTECGDKKLNVTDKDPKSWQTPLHIASRNDPSQVVIVNLLLQRSDTDVNALDKNNETPLHLAARNRSKSAIQLLLQHPDIKANLKNNKDQTPLDLARPKNARDQYCFELIRDFIDQKKTGNKGDGMPSISNPEVLDNGIMSYLKRNKFSDKSM